VGFIRGWSEGMGGGVIPTEWDSKEGGERGAVGASWVMLELLASLIEKGTGFLRRTMCGIRGEEYVCVL